MRKRKSNIVVFLLMLYLVVLAHNFISHRYDCELLNVLFFSSEKEIEGTTDVSGIYNGYDHFNVISNDVSLNVKKVVLTFDAVPVVNFYASVLYSQWITGRIPDVHSFYAEPINVCFLLRAPPLM